MKSCQKYRKQIALLAVESLEAGREPELRAHIDECADCQNYFNETASIAGKLQAATPKPFAGASLTFHRKVIAAVADTKRRSKVELWLAEFMSRWNWRLAVPVAALVAIAIAAWVMPPHHSETHDSSPVVNTAVATPQAGEALAPTVSNYELVARQSLDKLDALMTEQGSRNFSPPPTLTARQFFRITIVN